jgi:hypothetical protein
LTAARGIVVVGTYIIPLSILAVGLLFVAARGKPDKITIAWRALFGTLFGSVLLFGAFLFETILQGTIDQIEKGPPATTTPATSPLTRPSTL